MFNRRQFLGAIGMPAAAAALPVLKSSEIGRTLDVLSSYDGTAAEIAGEEPFWFEVQHAYTIDRSLVNLNNGGVCPAPRIVQQAMKDHWDVANKAPSYGLWTLQNPQKETVRTRIAKMFGCDREEIALTRNTSEGMQIIQQGLDLKQGDEMLTTTQDYPRMIWTWKQMEHRFGFVMKQFKIPVPCEDDDKIVSLFEKNITPNTKVIMLCHVINLTGQILPVKGVVEMARKKGIPVLVDGAHGFSHFEFSHSDLDCDYYATSLHKWLCAPHGTGMLYIRKNLIKDMWAMQPPPERLYDNIRKFEEIGTHPAAPYLATAEALTFMEGIGKARKEARLRFLRDRWAKRLMEHDRIRLNTSLKPEFSCGIGNVEIKGIDPVDLKDHLWKKHRIIVVPIKHAEFQGIRVTPNVYTTLEEVDRFADAMEGVIKNGL